jgi:hypothetical protein
MELTRPNLKRVLDAESRLSNALSECGISPAQPPRHRDDGLILVYILESMAQLAEVLAEVRPAAVRGRRGR